MNDFTTPEDQEPLYPATTQLPEFTFKSILLSIFLAVILAASNAYLALKIGTTISASIPASVLALGILSLFKRSNVLESNLAQTAASAGEGMAAAISFILPAMIILHIWKGFPYGETVVITVLGGLLGVFFAVPLRRVLLNLPGLSFPEGTAIGNVLKASSKGVHHMKFLIHGGWVGALVAFVQTGLNVVSSSLQMWTLTGSSVFGFALGFSPAPLAAGYIIGFEVALTLLVGVIVGWIVLLPIIGSAYGVADAKTAYDASVTMWSNYLRYVGVGTMLAGGIWTLFSLFKPIIMSVKVSFMSLRKESSKKPTQVLRTDLDIPVHWVLISVLLLAALLFVYIFTFLRELHIQSASDFLWLAGFCSVFYVLIVGFLLAMISGYVCGLIGSTNNPIAGLLIAAVLLLSFIFLLIFRAALGHQAQYIASSVIVIAAVIAGVTAISGENIQDLKAGKMLGATPWKQQLMMAIGVVVASLVIGPILDLLFNAYGMAGVYPHPGMDPVQMLAAPQAGLMAAVTRGVLTHQLNWDMILIGAALAVVVIIADEFLKRRNFRLPALAVGVGIYLPPEVVMPVVIGGVVSYFVKRRKRSEQMTSEQKELAHGKHQRGVLLACGMVAGSALMGVLLAIPFVILGSSDALTIVSKAFLPLANVLGVVVFLALCYWFYRVGRYKG